MDPEQPLGRFLPQLYDIAEGEGALQDVHGSPMPPCIIMEKGEALDVWIDNSGEKIDLFTGLQVLCNFHCSVDFQRLCLHCVSLCKT